MTKTSFLYLASLLMLCFTFSSCSDGDEGSGAKGLPAKGKLSPPEWLIGRWYYLNQQAATITSDDVYMGGSFRERQEYDGDNGYIIRLRDESKTENSYSFYYDEIVGSSKQVIGTYRYIFTRISSTEVQISRSHSIYDRENITIIVNKK